MRKAKSKRIWYKKCEQVLAYEENLEAKDVEIALLKAQLLAAMMKSNSETSLMPLHRVEQDGLSRPVSTGEKSDGLMVSK